MALGLITPEGPAVLVYEGVQSFLGGMHLHPISEEATSLAIGRLDDDRLVDLAVVAGGEVSILHGYEQLGAVAPTDNTKAGQLEKVLLPFDVETTALGEFIWDRDYRTEIAALAKDGTGHIVARGELDTRPITADEMIRMRRDLERKRAKAERATKNGETSAAASPASPASESLKWQVVEDLPALDKASVSTQASISDGGSSASSHVQGDSEARRPGRGAIGQAVFCHARNGVATTFRSHGVHDHRP